MKNFLRLQSLFGLLFISNFIFGGLILGQGQENFSNLPTTTSTSYLSRTWTGTDGVEWNANGARTDQTITGKAICWGNSGTRDIISPVYTGGMGTLSFKYSRAFTGTNARSLEVYVNSNLISTITVSPTSDEIFIYSENINVIGNVVLEIRSTGAAQVKLDDISWNGYNPVAGTLTNFAITPTSANTGQQVTFTWDAVDVSFIKFQANDGEGWFDLEALDNVDATLGTINFVIPANAGEGTFNLRIVDKNNSAVVSNIASITITDVHFAGVYQGYPFFPANEATWVSTDLFRVFESDGNDEFSFQKLAIFFNEDVKAGSGTIKLFKKAGSVLVYTFDVTGIQVVFNDYLVYVNIGANLLPDTEYYVTIDNGAIVDMAATPNAFDGNIVWGFTTGGGDSYRTIAEIREPVDLNVSDESPYLNQNLVTAGLVTHKRSNGFYIQNGTLPWSGLFVFNSTFTPGVQVGDWVALIGKVSAFNNMTQLQNILSLTVTDQFSLPEPVLITMPFDKTNSEPWESMLVKVENVVHTTDGPAVTGTEFKVSDGTSIGIIDDYLFGSFTPAVNQEFTSIAGIMNNYQASYKLAPRNADDIVAKATRVTDPKSIDILIYPNPVQDELRIRSDENISKVEVINMAGQVVAVKNNYSILGEDIVIPLAKKDDGVYVVNVTTKLGDVVVKKVVKK